MRPAPRLTSRSTRWVALGAAHGVYSTAIHRRHGSWNCCANCKPLCRQQCCDGQQRRGIFTPHATLTHFPSREAAEEAREALAKSWQPISFSSTEAVHILRRDGDGGQFERAWTLPLGGTLPPTHYDPPLRFAAMPAVEEDWVRQARKDAYRPGMRGRGNRRRRPRRSPEERKAIEARTPEEIAAIRAERAAKRERLQPDADAAGAAQSSLGEI